MKLDERFKVLPFCCFGAEKCVKYIGQKGYFTDNIDFFKNIDFCIYGTLEEVHAEQADSFQMDNKKFFRYFIPEYFVKPKEKKYRPYTFDDFRLQIGELIRFRKKGDHNFEISTMYIGYIKYDGIVKVLLGNIYYSLEELFNQYELYDSDLHTWKIFGVEE